MSNEEKRERENQEKSLGRLRWLIQRSNVGYNGNPPPFENPKTQKSVELAKNRDKKKFAGDSDFLPFRRGGNLLAEDSRPTKHLRGIEKNKFEKSININEFNYFHQRLDNSTGRPEIILALCWDLKSNDNENKKSEKISTDVKLSHYLENKSKTKGISNPYLATLSRAERTAVYRAEILSHPKFTKESREYWAGDAWYRGTQLKGPLHVKVNKSSIPSTRNCIRMKS